MDDSKPFHHGDDGTHSACHARIKVEGGKAQCCICVPHDGCGMVWEDMDERWNAAQDKVIDLVKKE